MLRVHLFIYFSCLSYLWFFKINFICGCACLKYEHTEGRGRNTAASWKASLVYTVSTRPVRLRKKTLPQNQTKSKQFFKKNTKKTLLFRKVFIFTEYLSRWNRVPVHLPPSHNCRIPYIIINILSKESIFTLTEDHCLFRSQFLQMFFFTF